MIAAKVGTWKRFCVCFVGTGLEVLGCQNEVYLAKGLGVISESWVSDENQCSRPSREVLPPEVKGAISVWTPHTPLRESRVERKR